MVTIKIIAGVLLCCVLLLMAFIGIIISFEVVRVVIRNLKRDYAKRLKEIDKNNAM